MQHSLPSRHAMRRSLSHRHALRRSLAHSRVFRYSLSRRDALRSISIFRIYFNQHFIVTSITWLSEQEQSTAIVGDENRLSQGRFQLKYVCTLYTLYTIGWYGRDYQTTISFTNYSVWVGKSGHWVATRSHWVGNCPSS